MRIGVQAPGMRQLNPAWVVVDGCTKDVAAKFVKVFVGTNDSMVNIAIIVHTSDSI